LLAPWPGDHIRATMPDYLLISAEVAKHRW
jgi:hypothetical protein